MAIRLHDTALHWKLLLNPQIALPEAYMFGTLTIEKGTLDDFLLLLANNNQEFRNFFMSNLQTRLRYGLRKLWQDNSPDKARHNVHPASERIARTGAAK